MDPDKFLSAKGDSQLNAIYSLKGQYHGRYHDFWPKLTKFKL